MAGIDTSAIEATSQAITLVGKRKRCTIKDIAKIHKESGLAKAKITMTQFFNILEDAGCKVDLVKGECVCPKGGPRNPFAPTATAKMEALTNHSGELEGILNEMAGGIEMKGKVESNNNLQIILEGISAPERFCKSVLDAAHKHLAEASSAITACVANPHLGDKVAKPARRSYFLIEKAIQKLADAREPIIGKMGDKVMAETSELGQILENKKTWSSPLKEDEIKAFYNWTDTASFQELLDELCRRIDYLGAHLCGEGAEDERHCPYRGSNEVYSELGTNRFLCWKLTDKLPSGVVVIGRKEASMSDRIEDSSLLEARYTPKKLPDFIQVYNNAIRKHYRPSQMFHKGSIRLAPSPAGVSVIIGCPKSSKWNPRTQTCSKQAVVETIVRKTADELDKVAVWKSKGVKVTSIKRDYVEPRRKAGMPRAYVRDSIGQVAKPSMFGERIRQQMETLKHLGLRQPRTDRDHAIYRQGKFDGYDSAMELYTYYYTSEVREA